MQDLTGAPLHLGGGAAGKSEQEDAPRIGSAADQMGHAVGKRVGLARAGARDDQQRAAIAPRCIAPVLDGATLPGVEGVEIVVRAIGPTAAKRLLRSHFVLIIKHRVSGSTLASNERSIELTTAITYLTGQIFGIQWQICG